MSRPSGGQGQAEPVAGVAVTLQVGQRIERDVVGYEEGVDVELRFEPEQLRTSSVVKTRSRKPSSAKLSSM
jgi:hypothetical protein